MLYSLDCIKIIKCFLKYILSNPKYSWNIFNNFIQKQDYYKYLNLKKKWIITNANIWFNKACIQKNIIPQYAKSKNKPSNKVSDTGISNKQYSKLRINNELKFLYKKKDCLSLQIYKQELKLMNLFDTFWHNIKYSILEKLSKIATNKYQFKK